MTQYARPDSEVSNAGYTATGHTNTYDCVNETSYDDADYIRNSASSALVIEFGLSNVTDPLSSSNHTLRLRAKATGSGAAERWTVTVRQGTTTLIATAFNNTSITRSAFNDYSYTLTSGEADAITDYTDLRVRISSTCASGETVDISWIVLDVPDETVSDRNITGITDGLTIGESQTITNSQLGDISKSDGITLSDVLTQIELPVEDLNIGASGTIKEDILIGESVTVQNQQLGDISKSDGLTIGETQTLQNSQLGNISISDGLTIGESKTVEKVSIISASDGVTLGDSVSYFTEEIILSESVTVVLGEAPAGDRDVNKSDGLTIGESVSLINTLANVSVTDGITLGESSTQSLSSPTISGISNNITLGDTVTVTLPDALVVSVSDGLTLGESQTISGLGEHNISVSDNVTLGEPTFSGWGTIDTSVTDNVTVADTLTNIQHIGEGVVVTDGVTLGESTSVETAALKIDKREDLNVNDTVARELVCNIAPTPGNTITLGESVTVRNQSMSINVSDGITMGDQVVMSSIVADRTISKSDGLTVGESVTITKLAITVNVTDGVTVGDQSTVLMAGISAISKSDGVTVGETVTVTPLLRRIDKREDLHVDEIVSVEKAYNIVIPAGIIPEKITLGESVTVMVGGLLSPTDAADVNETVSVTTSNPQVNARSSGTLDFIVGESVSVVIPELMKSSTDNITLGETTTVILSTGGEIVINHTDNVMINITSGYPEYDPFTTVRMADLVVDPSALGTGNVVNVGDSANVSLAYNINVTDNIRLALGITPPVSVKIPYLNVNETENILLNKATTPEARVVIVSTFESNRTDDISLGEEVYLAISSSPTNACCQAWDEAYYSVVIGDELYYRADIWEDEYYRVEIGDKDCGK